MKTTASLRGQPYGANPAGQPCGAAYPAYPAFDLRCAPLFEVLKQPDFVSKDGQRQCARNVPQRQNKRFLAYFKDILAVPRKKARFGPILAYFEAIFGLHLAARGPTGQLWAQNWSAPSEPTTYPGHFRWVSNSQGLIQYLRGGALGTFEHFGPF